MKCEAKKRSGENCQANAMISSKYCYMHSFGKFKNIPWYKNLTVHGIAIISIMLTLILFFLGPSKAQQDKIFNNTERIKQDVAQKYLDRNKIFLGIRYAYEFNHYRGATNTFGNEDRIVNTTIPLRQKYDAEGHVKFVFSIVNQNKGIPFEDVFLQVIWPDEIIEVKPGEGWQTQNSNKRYTYYFSQINNVPLNTYGPIWAKFPKPGEYTLLCSINGRSVDDAISVPVKIELY